MKFLLIAMLFALSSCSNDQTSTAYTVQAPNFFSTAAPAKTAPEIFTPEELKFIAENPVIKVGVDVNYPPFIFYNEEGKIVGLSKEYMDQVAKISGLNLSIQWVSQRAEIFEALRSGGIDLMTSVRPAPDRKDLMFTQPYVVVQGVLVMKQKTDSAKLKKISVGKSYAAGTFLRQNFDSEVVDVSSDEESMHRILDNDVDAAIMSVEASSYLQNKLGVVLKEDVVRYTYPLGFAVRKGREDSMVLTSILIKSLNAVPEGARAAINQKWLKYPPTTLRLDDRKVVPQIVALNWPK